MDEPVEIQAQPPPTLPTPLEIKELVKSLDPQLDGRTNQPIAGHVLIASLFIGPDIEKIIEHMKPGRRWTTKYRFIAARLEQQEIWKDGGIYGKWVCNPETDLEKDETFMLWTVSFWLDAMVALGDLKRKWNEEKKDWMYEQEDFSDKVVR